MEPDAVLDGSPGVEEFALGEELGWDGVCFGEGVELYEGRVADAGEDGGTDLCLGIDKWKFIEFVGMWVFVCASASARDGARGITFFSKFIRFYF